MTLADQLRLAFVLGALTGALVMALVGWAGARGGRPVGGGRGGWPCGGGGDEHNCGEDSCCCAEPEFDDRVVCNQCGGAGGWPCRACKVRLPCPPRTRAGGGARRGTLSPPASRSGTPCWPRSWRWRASRRMG